MTKCYECGKELKFWNSYNHPTLGRKMLVCSVCFDKIEASMKKYRDFILSEFKIPEKNEMLIQITKEIQFYISFFIIH